MLSRTQQPTLYKKKIKKVAIVYRPQTNNAQKMAAELAHWLEERKIEVFSHPKQKLVGAKKLLSPKDLDMVVALGGDGTYLQAARMLEGEKVPLLGVNLGSLGFLTIHRAQDLYEIVQLALDNKLEVRPRSMIRVEVVRNKKVVQSFTALNDLVIERGPSSHLIHIGISIDKLQINSLKADGLIIATPTGSTAYNLAAGGPILHPEVDALVVTPVCPHSLTSRPFIFPDKRKISFQLIGTGTKAVLTVDGSKAATITARDEVVVHRDGDDHLILRKVSHNFFSLLRDKLKFGERA